MNKKELIEKKLGEICGEFSECRGCPFDAGSSCIIIEGYDLLEKNKPKCKECGHEL